MESTSHFSLGTQGHKGFDVRQNSGPLYKNRLTDLLGKLSSSVSEREREAIYALTMLTDKSFSQNEGDSCLVLQDRYWQSVVAYGRFLNNGTSFFIALVS